MMFPQDKKPERKELIKEEAKKLSWRENPMIEYYYATLKTSIEL